MSKYSKSNQGGKEKMTLRAFRVPDSLWNQVMEKANGLMSVSAIIRRLLEMWVNDEIDIARKK